MRVPNIADGKDKYSQFYIYTINLSIKNINANRLQKLGSNGSSEIVMWKFHILMDLDLKSFIYTSTI